MMPRSTGRSANAVKREKSRITYSIPSGSMMPISTGGSANAVKQVRRPTIALANGPPSSSLLPKRTEAKRELASAGLSRLAP